MEQQIAQAATEAVSQMWVDYPILAMLILMLLKNFGWDTLTRRKYQNQDKQKNDVQKETVQELRLIRDLLVAQTGGIKHVSDSIKEQSHQTSNQMSELRSMIRKD